MRYFKKEIERERERERRREVLEGGGNTFIKSRALNIFPIPSFIFDFDYYGIVLPDALSFFHSVKTNSSNSNCGFIIKLEQCSCIT